VKLFSGPRILWEFYPSLDADDSDLEKYTAFPATEIIADPFSTILPAKKTWIKVDYPENWRITSPFLDTRVSIARTRKVDSVQMIRINTQSELLELLREVTSMTRIVWNSSMLGELHEIVLSTDTPDELGAYYQFSAEIRMAVKVLHSWWISQHTSEFARNEDPVPRSQQHVNSLETSTSERFDDIVRVAALITCGIGVTAFEWSKKFLVPVTVSVAGKRMIALVPHSVSQSGGRYDYWLVGAIFPGERWTLVALDRIDQGVGTPCIFPWDVDLGSI
jgi:hypothetical protein